MEIEFQNKTLALLLTNRAAETRLPMAVISSFRRKIGVIRAAPDERTLRNWKSLHYEKLKGGRDGQFSIRLNDQWRIVFTVNTECDPPKMLILEVVDYH